MRRFLAALLAIGSLSSNASAGNFADCIIDGLDGAKNQAVYAAVYISCKEKYPLGIFAIERGSGRWLFGYKNGNACAMDKAKDTTHQQSAMVIRRMCLCLYDEPLFDGEKCAYPNQ